MITDPRVFTDEHAPRRVLHREPAVNAVLRRLSGATPAARGDVLLHGPSGVGKTALATHCCRRLHREQEVQTAAVRTLGTSTAGIVRGVLQDLPGDDPAANTPTADLCTMLRERVTEPTVVVLDEADDLPATDALPRLFDVPALSVVVICHDVDAWLARADRDVRERLGCADIRLDRYGVDDLADILEARARVGLAPDSVTRAQLERIADEVAGVARHGIQMLRAAAREAARRGHAHITEDVLDDAYALAQRRIRESNLSSLPFHHQVLYELVRTERAIGAERLHERYEAVQEAVYREQAVTPITKRDRRRKLRKLEEYGLIESAGENRNCEYRVCDGDVRVAIGVQLPL